MWRQLTLASGARPGRTGPTAPGPARGILFESRAEACDPACEILISPTVVQARFATFHLAGRLCPAWPVTSSGHFRVCLQAVTPPPRNFEPTTCLLARAQRRLWVAACCPQAAHEAESAMYVHIIPTFGYRSLVRVGCVVP